MMDVKEAKDRANMVNQIKNLTEEGKSLLHKGMIELNLSKSFDFFKAGLAKMGEAKALRDEFWKKYPNALILHNCPWMSKDVSS